MEKSEVRILIVEDDATLGRALFELFKRSGYDTVMTASPAQALGMVDRQEFHAMIVDCMLPKMNGVDLVREMLKYMDPKPAIFLMTGVFKDKSFVKDAVTKTGAITLLTKPFPPEQLLTTVETELKKRGLNVESESEPFPRLLTFKEFSSQQVMDTLKEQSTIDAYHLPLVLSLFARQGMTGHLDITAAGESENARITLIEGKIVDVRSKHPATQLGELLIEFGFAMPDDVEEALSTQKTKEPLGSRLVNASALSPHAVGIIREEQLAVRLSQLIQNNSLEITWNKQDVEMQDTYHAMPPSRLKNLMSEWVLSKIPAEWLRSFYLQFSERVISWRGKATMKIEGVKAHVTMLPELIKRLPENPTLQGLLLESGDDDLKWLQAIHSLILERKIFFGEKVPADANFEAKTQRLQRLLTSFEQKDFFEILGVSHRARSMEIQRSFTDLAKQLHPDKIPPNAPENLKKLAHQIFSKITNAYDCLSNEIKRQKYLESLSREEASRVFALEPIFETAMSELHSKRYPSALRKFEELLAKKAPMHDLRALYFWAKIKSGQKVSERDFFEIPPENRHSATYLMAKGLYYRSVSQPHKAIECFQNARMMDKRLVEAKRELEKAQEEAREGTIHTLISKILGTKSTKTKTKKSA